MSPFVSLQGLGKEPSPLSYWGWGGLQLQQVLWVSKSLDLRAPRLMGTQLPQVPMEGASTRAGGLSPPVKGAICDFCNGAHSAFCEICYHG